MLFRSLFLGNFATKYPAVELVVEELKTEEIIARLRDDTLDAGLASTPLSIAGLRETPVAIEPMLAYLPPGDPLLRRKSVSQAALRSRELWIMPEGHCFRSQVLSYCGGASPAHPSGIEFESGSFETLVRLVNEGLGGTVLPELAVQALPAAQRKRQVRPLVSPKPVREIGLVTARTDLRRRVSDALAEEIRTGLARVMAAPSRDSVRLDPVD